MFMHRASVQNASARGFQERVQKRLLSRSLSSSGSLACLVLGGRGCNNSQWSALLACVSSTCCASVAKHSLPTVSASKSKCFRISGWIKFGGAYMQSIHRLMPLLQNVNAPICLIGSNLIVHYNPCMCGSAAGTANAFHFYQKARRSSDLLL